MSKETHEIIVTISIDESSMSITPEDALEASNMIRVASERAVMLLHLRKFLCDSGAGMELDNNQTDVFLSKFSKYIGEVESATGT